MTIMSGAVPEPHCEDHDPEIAVSVCTIGEAAEILALISELITAEPAVAAAIARFLDRKGADPLPAASRLTASISELAAQLDSVLAREGISIDRGLARYWRPPAVAR